MSIQYGTELEAYRRFRDERLSPDKAHLSTLMSTLNLKFSDYTKLMEKSRELGNKEPSSTDPLLIPLDLGSGFEADFEIYDRDFVFVAVGFGFYCQMTWKEAEAFCIRKVELLQRKRARLERKLKEIVRHLDTTNSVITELSKSSLEH